MERHAGVYYHKKRFDLESGGFLPDFKLAYTTYGTLNGSKSNVIWIVHALTANSDPVEWWPGMVGENKTFDPGKHFIVCVNNLCSPYGSTNPLSMNKNIGHPYYHAFPLITIRDTVRAFDLVRRHLKIKQIDIAIGASMGGQQVLEWAIYRPRVFRNITLLATNAKHSSWGIAFNETQRLAIQADPTWIDNSPTAGLQGLKAARAIALLSYRNYGVYNATQIDKHNMLHNYRASSYQEYQGDKLVKRFNTFSYWYLTKMMDSHNVGRGRVSIKAALSRIIANTLIIGIRSDLLFPPQEQEFLQNHIQGSRLQIINSDMGHDGFLVEAKAIEDIILNHCQHVNKINCW